MNKNLKKMLDEEFKEVVNSDRAERALKTAIRVLDTLRLFDKKYEPQATNEIAMIEEVTGILEGMACLSG